MDVSDVLRDRMQEPGGLQRMVGISVLLHAAAFSLAVVAPAAWFAGQSAVPRTVMTISLGGGAPGPQNGGLTSIGGRPVQAEPLPDAPRREAVRPPAAETPAMTLPKNAVTRGKPTTPAPVVKQAPSDARGRTPTRGDQVSAGSSLADTGVRGQGFGLSTGGGGGGTGLRLDVGDFCCPDYLLTMTARVQSNWSPRAENPAQAVVKFTIQRDGTITDIELEQSSRYTALDLAAQRALATTRQLPPLPAAYANPSLTIHLTFQYTR